VAAPSGTAGGEIRHDAAPDVGLPAFDVARVERSGDMVISGRAMPGATVELLRNGKVYDPVVADASGQFAIVPPRLPAGDSELTTLSRGRDLRTDAARRKHFPIGGVRPTDPCAHPHSRQMVPTKATSAVSLSPSTSHLWPRRWSAPGDFYHFITYTAFALGRSHQQGNWL
jgi:hypothetical protein